MSLNRIDAISLACALALSTGGAFATSQDAGDKSAARAEQARQPNEDAKEATELVDRAAQVLQRMNGDPELRETLNGSRGVFVVPQYGQAALGVGARGGRGVLLVNQEGKWSPPAFYRLGGVSLGLQAGAEAGAIALVLNNQKAIDSFKQSNNWSLNADAGLTIVNWSRKAQGSVGKGDITAWADTKGLMGDLAVSVTDINFDRDKTAAFYGKRVALDDILRGSARAPAEKMAALRKLQTGSSQSSGADQESSGK